MKQVQGSLDQNLSGSLRIVTLGKWRLQDISVLNRPKTLVKNRAAICLGHQMVESRRWIYFRNRIKGVIKSSLEKPYERQWKSNSTRTQKTKELNESVILDKPQQKQNIIPSLNCSGSYYEDLKTQFNSSGLARWLSGKESTWSTEGLGLIPGSVR